MDAIRKKAKEEKSGVVEELKGRRSGKREYEYEVIWEGDGREDSWLTRTELLQMGYKKMLDEKDEQIAMDSLLGQRKLTTGEIQKHFDGFGLEPAFAQHTRMAVPPSPERVKEDADNGFEDDKAEAKAEETQNNGRRLRFYRNICQTKKKRKKLKIYKSKLKMVVKKVLYLKIKY